MKKIFWICLFSMTAFSIAVASQDKATYGYVDYLLWQVSESGAENWAQIIPPAGSQRPIKLIGIPFNWSSGFRLGVGHEFNHDCFDVELVYTHYQTQASQQVSGLVYSSFVGNYFANNTNGANFGPNYNQANARWQIFYNTVDLNLGRHFRIAPVLEVHPYIGLKTAVINQNIYTQWFNPVTATNFTSAAENLTNHFWGVGPTLGAETTWPIFKCGQHSFDLIGNIGLGLLYGHWTFNDIYKNNAPTTITVNVNSVNGAAPVANGLLGVQWDHHWNQFDTHLRLGYESQAWFKQVQFYSLNMGRLSRTMWFQGGNLECRINF